MEALIVHLEGKVEGLCDAVSVWSGYDDWTTNRPSITWSRRRRYKILVAIKADWALCSRHRLLIICDGQTRAAPATVCPQQVHWSHISPCEKKLKRANMVITEFSENISYARIIKWLTYKPVLVLPYIIIADECPMNYDNGHMARSSSSLLVKRVLFACYCITYNRKMWILRQLHLQSTDWSDAPPKIAPVASTSAQKGSLK